MKINPNSLRRLRERLGVTRSQLAEWSGINKRTIQRLENEPQQCQKTRKYTLECLAKALGVEENVLTGPPPESDKAPAYDPDPVQIGAQVAPKVRLAYDLIKRRYGVSATEVINMAPLFFALLAEGSLAWRSEKLKEVEETKSRLEQIEGFWRGGTLGSVGEGTLRDEGVEGEADSIAKADLFGEHLISDTSIHNFFDPSRDNPFASYLCKLKAKLGITDDDKVKVGEEKDGDLVFGSPLKFPDYDICRDELDSIANGSSSAKVTLEAGHVKLSEIPEELMVEDAGEERAKWLEDKLSGTLKDLEKEIKDLEKKRKEVDDRIAEIRDNLSKGIYIEEGLEIGELLAEQVRLDERREEMAKRREELVRSLQKTNSNIEKGGDDQ